MSVASFLIQDLGENIPPKIEGIKTDMLFWRMLLEPDLESAITLMHLNNLASFSMMLA